MTMRFFNKIHYSDGCWEWTAGKMRHGYGYFRNSFGISAHRYMWYVVHGEVPKLCVLHTCDNPGCVRPSHLFTGTNKDNSMDMVAKGRHGMSKKTHCLNGHEFTEANIYPSALKNGGTARACRLCRRERSKLFKRKKRELQKAI